MNAPSTLPLVFHYPRLTRIGVNWILAVSGLCAFLGISGAQRGLADWKALTFLSVVGTFFFLGWVVSQLQTNAITVDEDALHTTAMWGMARRSWRWKDVERIEHSREAHVPGKYTLAQTYYLLIKGERNLIGLQPRHVGATKELEGFPELLAIFEHKSAEFGFPIKPMP